MPLSQSELRILAGAASTLAERLSRQAPAGDQDDTVLRERLSAWCQASAGGDWQRFQKRLSWDGLDLDSALHLLAPASLPASLPLPAWTSTLQEALCLLENGSGDEPWPALGSSRPLPFEDLLTPFVALAQQRLHSQVGALVDELTPPASLTLQQYLLHNLVSLSMPTLHAEFEATRSDEPNRYQNFLQRMRHGGLARLFCQYSVLGRLLATTCDLWVEANAELLRRLASDRPELEALFGGDLGPVSAIQPALSDLHAGRRSVMALTFALGCQLIYKPRPVGMEETWYRLLQWCNEQGVTPPFKILSILNRATYGWMEYVEHKPCQNTEQLRSYYQRAGMLLCLVYVLGGVDCFYDQLIAHGEHPLLVDATHLLQPFVHSSQQLREGEDWEQALYSILHSGLLATWPMPASEPESVLRTAPDVSGLGMSLPHIAVAQEPANSPGLKLRYGSFKPRLLHNLVMLANAGEPVDADTLYKELSIGFQDMYHMLLRQRPLLLAARSPLQGFREQMVRFPYRDRSSYEDLAPSLLAPQALKDGIARSILCDPLGLTCAPLDWFRMGRRDFSFWWPAFAAERQALLQGDVPLVWAYTHQDALLVAPDQPLASCLCQPAFHLLMSRVERLGKEDLSLQLQLLKQALPVRSSASSFGARFISSSDVELASGDAGIYLEHAISIADDLAACSIEADDKSLLWVNAGFDHYQYYQLRPMRYGFSDGMSGIAFFLAALSKLTGIVRYRHIAAAAVRPLHRLVCEEGVRLRLEMGPGGCPGLGSLIYALTRSGQFLDDAQMVATARAAANLITPEYIAGDHLLDVHLGTAGAILGLLALYEVVPEQAILDRAFFCGEHLLRARTLSNADCLAWPTLGGAHTTGFAHGTAGIVYALLHLYAVTREADLLKAAQEGLHYEDRAFNPEIGNWAEIVGTEAADTAGNSWCHGAPGIGLARVGALSILDTPTIRSDIENALQSTLRLGAMGLDHLCCGICGRIEFLLTAAQRLGDQKLASSASQLMSQLLARAERRGAFATNLLLPEWVAHPHFLQGISGIGYTLLRLAHPDLLPSPLLWE